MTRHLFCYKSLTLVLTGLTVVATEAPLPEEAAGSGAGQAVRVEGVHGAAALEAGPARHADHVDARV